MTDESMLDLIPPHLRSAPPYVPVQPPEVLAQRLGLPEGDTGVGYTAEQVAQFQMPPLAEVQGYFDAVREEMLTYLRDLDPSELDTAPQRSPFPEIGSLPDDFTIGRMFRQLIGEYNQHLGQVGYLRGMQRGLNQ